MKPIRNIIFDMGQVLMYFRPQVYMEQQHIAPEDQALAGKEIFRTVEWTQLDRGTISKEQAAKQVCARLPERLHEAAREIIFHWWDNRPLMPVPGMKELVQEVKELGYGVYLLSNANLDLHNYFHKIPGAEYFDGKIVSADWKLLKPQHEIYEKLTEVYGLELEECVFIDDAFLNVEGAIHIGMQGIIFDDDVCKLRKDLNELGVPVKA